MENEAFGFEQIARSPYTWRQSALQLKRAAELIDAELAVIIEESRYSRPRYEDLKIFNSYMLLAGLALESLAKGIWIGRNPTVVVDGKLSIKSMAGLGGHGITGLIRKIGILDEIETKLCDRLQRFVQWAGKYPISTTYQESPAYVTSDPKLFNSLFNRLHNILLSEFVEDVGHV